MPAFFFFFFIWSQFCYCEQFIWLVYSSCVLLLLLSHFSHVQLSSLMDSSPPGSPIPGILQARTLGCHFLLQCMKMKREREVVQSCLTLSDPMDCSLPGSSIHGIFQAKSTGLGCHRLLCTISLSLLKLMSIESVMPSNRLILCRPLFFLPSIFLNIRVFSNESFFHSRSHSNATSISWVFKCSHRVSLSLFVQWKVISLSSNLP